jgi:hypothetical protein
MVELNSSSIISMQDHYTSWLHDNPANHHEHGSGSSVIENHLCNFSLWHLEDKARNPLATDLEIKEIKKEIDRMNQVRNDAIENIDCDIIKKYPFVTSNMMLLTNTETPGSAIDRLSILSLKIYHMNEQAIRKDADEEHRLSCKVKVRVLKQQRNDLSKALDFLVSEIIEGKKRLQLYRQFKMYNDKNLNPEIYQQKESK